MHPFLISWKIIFSKKQYKNTDFSFYASIFISSIAIATSILILGISNNYENSIKESISSIEPQYTIFNYYNKNINDLDMLNIEAYLKQNNFLEDINLCGYSESYGMIKYKSRSIGVLIYGIDERCLLQIYDFEENRNLNFDKMRHSDDFLYISTDIYEKLDMTENITLLSIPEIVHNEKIRAINSYITNVYKTKMNRFDSKVIFVSHSQFNDLFDSIDNNYTGIMMDTITELDNELIISLENEQSLSIIRWEQKYQGLFTWLTIFSNPIKMIMMFILSLSSIYFIFTLFLLLYDKTNLITKLQILGTPYRKIASILLYVYCILIFISIILATTLSMTLEYLIRKLNLIPLDPSIYIIDNLNSSISIYNIINVSLMYISLTIFPLFLFIVLNKSSNKIKLH